MANQKRTARETAHQHAQELLNTPVANVELHENNTPSEVVTQEELVPVEKTAKKVRQPKAEKVEFKFVECPADQIKEDGTIQVPISMLVPIDTIPTIGVKVMRQINSDQAQHYTIAMQNGEVFPPLSVQLTTYGVVVYDGYHRWTAYENMLKARQEAKNALSQLETVRNQFMVTVRPANFTKEFQLIQAAFDANMKNGLPMSEGSRVRYAIWLITSSIERGQKKLLSMRKAAAVAGCTHGAISRQLKRDADKAGKMVDEFVNPADVDEVKELAQVASQKEEVDSFQVATKKLFSAISAIVDIEDDTNDLAAYFVDFLKDGKEEDVLTIMSALQKVVELKSELKSMREIEGAELTGAELSEVELPQ